MDETYKLSSPDTGEIEKKEDQLIFYNKLFTSFTESFEFSTLFHMIDFSESSEIEWEEILNKRRFKQLKKKHSKELLRIIFEQNFDYGFDSSADLFIRKFLKQNSVVTKEWLNSLFLEYFNDSRVVIGLLQIISHLDYLEIYPQGPTMALAALSHIDSEVKECGIRAFENWETLDSLKVLRTISYPEKWLQEYVDQVIADLEEQLEENVFSD